MNELELRGLVAYRLEIAKRYSKTSGRGNMLPTATRRNWKLETAVQPMNWLDFILLFIFVLILYNGFRHGFMRQVVGLTSFIIAFYVAIYWSGSVREFLEKYLRADEVITTLTEEGAAPVWLVDIIINIIAFLLAFLVISLVLAFIAKRLRFLNRVPLIGPLNAVLGGLLGAAKGVLVVFLIASLLSLLEFGLWERAVESSVVVALSQHYVSLLFHYMLDLVAENLGVLT